MDFIREVFVVCYNLNCPYELPNGECAAYMLTGSSEIPKDASCYVVDEEEEEEDERI